jgi:ribonuclease HII
MTSRLDPELLPVTPDLAFEKLLWAAGTRYVAGIDEVGRGALAGPVGAAVVIFPSQPERLAIFSGMQDSKKQTPGERLQWAEKIRLNASAWAVGFASAREVDLWGLLPATRLAISRALDILTISPRHLLLDYLFLPDSPIPQTSLIKGDERCLSIAAASVLAKTARDQILVDMDSCYPRYGFAAHKGYATSYHRASLQKMGPCPLHRFSYAPVRNAVRGHDHME